MAKTTIGKCITCGNEYSKMAMKRHLDKCPGRNVEPGEQRYFLISVQGRYETDYWLYLEASASTTLRKLDSVLRDVWLECCGHLSSFYIEGDDFSVSVEPGSGERSMNTRMDKVLRKGLTFEYEYDFGSTTSLKLKVVDERYGKKKQTAVELLSRNVKPVIACSACAQPAVSVCVECIYEESGWLCESCAESHECGEEMLLPVVNSPRVGVCAYCGDDEGEAV